MKKIVYIGLMTTSVFLVSCNIDTNKEGSSTDQLTEIYMSKSATDLKESLFKRVNDESEINTEIALQSIIELFKNSSPDTTSNEKPIDLYVIYSVDLWEEYDETETFQITLANQMVENKVLYENRISLTYEPDSFSQINEFDIRYNRKMDDLETFKNKVKDSEGFRESLLSSPTRIEVIKEEI